MSVSTSMKERAVVEAIDACDRLASKLAELIEHHEHAASRARPDWTGPHHDTFEARVMNVRRTLEAGRQWVLHARHEAEGQLAAVRAEAAVLRMSGAR